MGINYEELIEQRTAELMKKIKPAKRKREEQILSSRELLPNHRTTSKCCANCWFYNSGYEGEGDCLILKRLKEKFAMSETTWIFPYTHNAELCDYWVKYRKEA